MVLWFSSTFILLVTTLNVARHGVTLTNRAGAEARVGAVRQLAESQALEMDGLRGQLGSLGAQISAMSTARASLELSSAATVERYELARRGAATCAPVYARVRQQTTHRR